MSGFSKLPTDIDYDKNIHQVECKGMANNDCDGGEHPRLSSCLTLSQVVSGGPPGGKVGTKMTLTR